MRRETVISLGAAVQSSATALMSSEGTLADTAAGQRHRCHTHWEPPSVYSYLELLEGRLRFPIHVVDNGRSFPEDVKSLTSHPGAPNHMDISVRRMGRGEEDGGTGRVW